MKIRNAIGLQVVNTPGGPGVHVPHARSVCEPDLIEQPGFLSVVLLCQQWQDRPSVEQALAREAGCAPAQATKAVDTLLEHGVLISDADEEQVAGVRALEGWSAYNWAAPFCYQWHNDNLPRLDYAAGGKAQDMAWMREYLQEDPVPSNYKHVAGAPIVKLERDVRIEHRPIWDLLAEEDETSHPDRPLGLSELSWMTYLAFGQTDKHTTYYGERLAKTSPSGGARHPVEAYLLVLDVDGLEPGAYHYNVEHHALELLRTGDFGSAVEEHLLRQPNLAPFKHRFVYLTAARFERTMWRYRESFSYRSVNHDVGHLMESTRLLARALRRNHFRGFTPKESALEPLLGLDGIEESVMTFSIIG